MHVKVASISEWHCQPNTLSFLLYHQLTKPEAEQIKQTYTHVHTYNIHTWSEEGAFGAGAAATPT